MDWEKVVALVMGVNESDDKQKKEIPENDAVSERLLVSGDERERESEGTSSCSCPPPPPSPSHHHLHPFPFPFRLRAEIMLREAEYGGHDCLT